MIRDGERWKTFSITGPISRSAVTKPGTSAFVESTRNRSTPSSPRRENPARSVSRPSSGSWSSLMSPVCSTRPAGVRIATASASGIEWLTAKYSQSHGPCRSRAPSATSSRCGVRRCSLHFSATSASVNRDPTTVRSGRWRSRNGTAPMWSSWPWVSTRASISSRRSSMARKSGRIRSTPGESSDGNSTPQSTTSSRPSCSNTVMFRPTSPMPPSATTRRAPAGSGGGGPMGSSARLTSSGGAGAGRPWSRRGGRGRRSPRERSDRAGGRVTRSQLLFRHRRARRVRAAPTASTSCARANGTPASARSSVISSTCSAVAGTSGSRGSPTSTPRSRSAALLKITPPTRPIARITGKVAACTARARSTSPAS